MEIQFTLFCVDPAAVAPLSTSIVSSVGGLTSPPGSGAGYQMAPPHPRLTASRSGISSSPKPRPIHSFILNSSSSYILLPQQFLIYVLRCSLILCIKIHDHMEKEMATHSSVLAWRIPWTEEPGRLQSTGSRDSDTTERSTRLWLVHS